MMDITAEVLFDDPRTAGQKGGPDDERFGKAVKILEQMRFSVLVPGEFSITISGTVELFEQIFQIRFEKRAKRVLGGSDVEFYAPLNRPTIPERLKGVIYDIVFPVPPDFF